MTFFWHYRSRKNMYVCHGFTLASTNICIYIYIYIFDYLCIYIYILSLLPLQDSCLQRPSRTYPQTPLGRWRRSSNRSSIDVEKTLSAQHTGSLGTSSAGIRRSAAAQHQSRPQVFVSMCISRQCL